MASTSSVFSSLRNSRAAAAVFFRKSNTHKHTSSLCASLFEVVVVVVELLVFGRELHKSAALSYSYGSLSRDSQKLR